MKQPCSISSHMITCTVSTNFKTIIADWDEHQAVLQEIRKTVFIDEQSVPADLEWDEHDKYSTHFLVTDNNKAIATGRLKNDGQIGRMAVIMPFRRLGAGSMLLDFILDHARQTGFDKVYCHAQVAVINFYLKKGFEMTGEVFLDANIPHQAMFKKICY